MPWIAHLSEDRSRSQTVQTHLEQTAKRAEGFAASFFAQQQAHLCGLLHDIGKYSDAFQQRIAGKKHFVDHATAGAQLSAIRFKNLSLSFCIAGHHGGLPDLGGKLDSENDRSLRARLKRTVEPYDSYQSVWQPPLELPHHALERNAQDAYFYIKMLYSCLVDADFLDTEQFMNGTVERSMGELCDRHLEALNQKIAPWLQTKIPLNQKRTEILQSLIQAAPSPKGLFTLTVPTGGGKTVASMAFGLHHAKANKQRRILYVIPYTSIIEQTKAVFEEIFGAESVLAHYANVEYQRGEQSDFGDTHYLASENWDAPIVLTTAVQFFESLFSDKPSRSRKLHNIADSVIIFDEAQMLPVPELLPCVYAISQLVKHYGCTAVLCTATQPALNPLFADFLPDAPLRELCPPLLRQHPIFARVQFSMEGKLSDSVLRERLLQQRQVLCIVGSRRAAQHLYASMEGEENFHLSTTMYPLHRHAVLNTIRERLRNGLPCRVISTSLVEAGVDLDFPTVYRSLAGLDNILQAAGRCNREGKRSQAESIVHIFESEHQVPETLLQNISAAKRTIAKHQDLQSSQAMDDYFRFLLYTLKDKSALDSKQVYQDICDNKFSFRSIGERFHLIENGEFTIYIPQEEGEVLVSKLQQIGPSRGLLRALGQYAVGVYPHHFAALVAEGSVELVSENSGILRNMSLYDRATGLAFSQGEALGQAICI